MNEKLAEQLKGIRNKVMNSYACNQTVIHVTPARLDADIEKIQTESHKLGKKDQKEKDIKIITDLMSGINNSVSVEITTLRDKIIGEIMK